MAWGDKFIHNYVDVYKYRQYKGGTGQLGRGAKPIGRSSKMTNTITLKALETVRHANWNGCTARVNTARAYAIQNERCPDKAEKACREFGHDVVWTMYSGGTLMADGPAKDAHYAKLDADFKRAVILADGDTVEIEGAIYTVKFNRGNTGEFPTNSDPIRFEEAEDVSPNEDYEEALAEALA